jgi:hypothetical protein
MWGYHSINYEEYSFVGYDVWCHSLVDIPSPTCIQSLLSDPDMEAVCSTETLVCFYRPT